MLPEQSSQPLVQLLHIPMLKRGRHLWTKMFHLLLNALLSSELHHFLIKGEPATSYKNAGVGGGGESERSGEGEEALLSFCSSHRTISNYRTKATHSGSELQHCSFACLMSALLNAKRTPGCCWGLSTPMHHLRTTRSSSVPLWIGTSSLGLFWLNKPSLIRSTVKMFPDRWEGVGSSGAKVWSGDLLALWVNWKAFYLSSALISAEYHIPELCL